MKSYRLPDVLVTNRSGAGLMVSVLCATLCSFGVVRACELAREASPSRMPDATSGSVAH